MAGIGPTPISMKIGQQVVLDLKPSPNAIFRPYGPVRCAYGHRKSPKMDFFENAFLAIKFFLVTVEICFRWVLDRFYAQKPAVFRIFELR